MTATVDQGTSSRQPSAQSGPGAGRSAPDSAATRYLFASTAFLALGAVLALGALVSMRFPGLFPISLGRLRPMAMIALLLGWLVPGMAAGLFYALPRLTGTPLRGDGRANAALPAIIAVVLGGIAIVLLGWGDGRAPFALPWWWDIPVLGLLSVPFLIVAGSLRDRREEVVYPTLWFAVAGVVWLPALYLIGNLPELSSVATALSDLVFEAGFISVWGLGVATGLAYYVVPKASGQPLANRQLARVGFWSLLFGGVFMGPAQLVAGPAPEWLQGVAAVLGLAFPIGALANTTNLALTIGPEWRDIGSRPVLLAAMAGSGLGSLAAVAAALAGFRSNGVLLAFTTFWDGVTHLLLLGALVLVFVAFAWHVVPNLVGRSLRSEARASRLVGRSAVAATVTAILLMLAGVITGYGWAGASFTGLAENSGADWQPMSIIPSALTGLALLAAIASVWYTVRLAFSVYSTLTTGRPTLQEVLVVEEEPPDDE